MKTVGSLDQVPSRLEQIGSQQAKMDGDLERMRDEIIAHKNLQAEASVERMMQLQRLLNEGKGKRKRKEFIPVESEEDLNLIEERRILPFQRQRNVPLKIILSQSDSNRSSRMSSSSLTQSGDEDYLPTAPFPISFQRAKKNGQRHQDFKVNQDPSSSLTPSLLQRSGNKQGPSKPNLISQKISNLPGSFQDPGPLERTVLRMKTQGLSTNNTKGGIGKRIDEKKSKKVRERDETQLLCSTSNLQRLTTEKIISPAPPQFGIGFYLSGSNLQSDPA